MHNSYFKLVLFLNGCKGDIDEAVKHIENYFEIKITTPELFWDRNPESSALQFSFKVQQMAPLPITPNNCYVFVHRVADLNPQNYYYDDVFKMFMMMAGKTLFFLRSKKYILIFNPVFKVC